MCEEQIKVKNKKTNYKEQQIEYENVKNEIFFAQIWKETKKRKNKPNQTKPKKKKTKMEKRNEEKNN